MAPQPPKSKARFPVKLGVLFEPHRYKVIYGGRGGGRSWGCARALLLEAAKRPLRILCAREVQKSIRDSVHKLLSDQIELLGFGMFFDIQEAVIKGKNGSEFIFAGLSNQTVESVKSYEGVDITWCEEAQIITKKSWDILIPTIRKPGSEIWITFNPGLESDETYQRFVKNPPPDSAVVKLNYKDNPWFPEVLELERLHCKLTNPDDYPNIWEGECKPAVEGAIYFKEIQEAIKNGRVCRVPYDPLLRVHPVFDLGFNDHMAICLVQRHVSEIRVIEYIQDTGKTLNDYSEMLKTRKYNWGRVWLPHDGYSSDYKTGFSSASIMRRLGWDVPERSEIVELSVEEGIRVVKLTFPQIYFDEENCKDLIECIKRYRRRINQETGVAGTPLHDDFSDGADALRYTCINAPLMFNNDPGSFWDDADRHHAYDEAGVDQATGY